MAGLSSDEASLGEMIAYVMNKHRSGCLTVRRRELGAVRDAKLYFDGGHLVDARLLAEVGDDIIYRLLGAKDRLEYGWESEVAAPGRSISRSDEFFLMATLGVDAGKVFDIESAAAKRAAAALRATAEMDSAPPQSANVAAAPDQTSPAEQLAAHPDLVESAHLRFSRHDSLPLPGGHPISLDEALGQSPRHLLSLSAEADLGALFDGLSKGLFSGYLCWERKGSLGTLMFYRGQIIDALWTEQAARYGATSDTTPATGNPSQASSGAAYRQITADAERENIRSYASLYELADEFVYSYSSLAYGENLLGSRSSRDVSLPNLLASLERNRHTGCVRLTLEQRVAASGEVPGAVSAYIFLSEGKELGRYIEEDGSLVADPTAPTALASNPHTLIDIYTSPAREAFDILTVPADAPDPGELLAQRDRRLNGDITPTPTLPRRAEETARRPVDTPPAIDRPATPTPRRAAPPTRMIDPAEALQQPVPPTPPAPPTPAPPPVVSRFSDSGRLTTNSGRLSNGPVTAADLSASLQQVAREVLANKAGRVVDILKQVEYRPQELTRIITQAKRATKMLIGIVEYDELSDKFDALLAAYKLNQSSLRILGSGCHRCGVTILCCKIRCMERGLITKRTGKWRRESLVDIETTFAQINDIGTQFMASSISNPANAGNAEFSLFSPATLVAFSRCTATLSTLHSISDVLENAVQALASAGAQSAMVVLHHPNKAIIEDTSTPPIIYRECGSEDEQFRYLVGSAFHKYSTSNITPPILAQPPYFGWAIKRLDTGYAYTTPIFVDDAPCGVLAFTLKPELKILSAYDHELLAGLAVAVGANVTSLQMMEATRHNAEELLVMYEIASIMAGATLDLKVLLRQTILIASRVVRASAATLMLLNPQANELIFEIPVGGGGEALNEFRMPVSEGIGGYVVREGRPLLVNDVANDPRWSAAADHVSGYDTHSVLCVPLQVHGRTIGALEVLNKGDEDGQPSGFTSDDTALLSAIATQAAAAIENAQLYQSLVQERDRIISTEEEVRRSFSRDLHDGPAQGLAALIMRIDLLKRVVSDAEALAEIDSLQSLAKRTNAEIRAMLSQLRPIVLETRGLVAAMQEFVAANQGDAGVSYHFTNPPDLDCSSLSDSAQAAIYVIIQEAVNNIKKHAHARNVWIEMSEQIVRFNYTRSGKLKSTSLLNNAPQRSLVIEVRDDGQGFDADKVLGNYSELGSYGLLNMRERAELLNGDLLIHSTVDQGTNITVRVPFPEPKS